MAHSMQPFTYERPSTVAEAVTLLACDGARALAGGTDLIAQLKEGRRTAARVVDLKHVPELMGVEPLADGGWRIGAAASIASLGRAGGLVRDYPGVVGAAQLIGSLQIQSRASLGGNLANGAPSADGVALLFSLDTRLEVEGPKGRRVIEIGALPAGPGRTTLEPGEVLVSILLSARAPRSAARYLRFTPRREMDIAIAGSGVAITLGDDGRIASARVTLASVAPIPLRASTAEAALIGQRPDSVTFAAAGKAAAHDAKPISDTRGSADYRRHLVGVLTRRALEAASIEIEARRAAA